VSRHWFVGLLLSCGAIFTAPLVGAAEDSAASVEAFISHHWQRPLQPQGEPPKGFSALEASLTPQACGTCHQQQLKDWQGSLHAHAMGPGLWGQIMDMNPTDRSEHQACLHCHAPLAEQADEVVATLSGENLASSRDAEENSFNAPLYKQGLICAGCHMREYKIHGPQSRQSTTPKANPSVNTPLPHNGWQSQDAFESSSFCAACHQFGSDGYELNGKLLENTFEEWKVSPQAKQGKSCQSCHMPDRRHLWRGIHDKATVLSGVDISMENIVTKGEGAGATLVMTNTGVGHRFPTYITPRVVVEAVQLDSAGKSIPETRHERIVARQVSLDLSQELFDTRLAPGEKVQLDNRLPQHPNSHSILFRIQVEPDLFYRDFYRSTLNAGYTDKGTETLRVALRNAEASVYTLFEKKIIFDL